MTDLVRGATGLGFSFAHLLGKFYRHSVQSHSGKFQRNIPLGAHFQEGSGIPWGKCLRTLWEHNIHTSAFMKFSFIQVK